MVYREYSYEILSVYLYCTVSISMLHFWCKGAAPLVPGCCTFTGTIIRKSLQWLFCRPNLLISV